MQDPVPAAAEARRHIRLKLPPAYTLVRVHVTGSRHHGWTGYAYDVSASGMRFDLESPIEPGTAVSVRAMLPGRQHTAFRATGRVVRIHDDLEDPGPIRMAMVFDTFATEEDRTRLVDYLNASGVRAA